MENKSSATSKYVRLSSNKVRRILAQIRGKKYEDALMILEFMPYRSCKTIRKILMSAASNYTYANTCAKKDMIISQAFANKGPVLKRFRPRAQGRAFQIRKHTCHITLNITTKN